MYLTLLDNPKCIFFRDRVQSIMKAKIQWNALGDLNIETVLDNCNDAGWFKANRPENVEVHTFNELQNGAKDIEYDLITFWHQFENESQWDVLVYMMPKIKRYVIFPTSSPVIGNEIKSFCSFHGLVMIKEISILGEFYRLWENQ